MSRTNTLEKVSKPALRFTRRILRGKKVYKAQSGVSTASPEIRTQINELDASKQIKNKAQDMIIPDTIVDVDSKEFSEEVIATIPLEIGHKSHEFSVYEEDKNVIIEDETEGKVYVINNPHTTPEASTSNDDNPQGEFNFFSLFKNSENDR